MGDDGFNMYDNLAQYDINKHIQQGVLFKKYGKKYYSDNQHTLMQETSSNTLGSIVEAMTGGNSTQGFGAGAGNSQPNDSIAAFNALVSSNATLYHT